MELAATFQNLAIALGLGLLVGLQRERTNARLAGVRTFPLITLFGTLSALLALTFSYWVLAVALAGLVALIVVGNLPPYRPKDPDPGLTSEVAMLVMFLVGAFLAVQQTAMALAVGGTVAGRTSADAAQGINTIFPYAPGSSTATCAFAASAKGISRPTTGRSVPFSKPAPNAA